MRSPSDVCINGSRGTGTLLSVCSPGGSVTAMWGHGQPHWESPKSHGMHPKISQQEQGEAEGWRVLIREASQGTGHEPPHSKQRLSPGPRYTSPGELPGTRK